MCLQVGSHGSAVTAYRVALTATVNMCILDFKGQYPTHDIGN